MSRLHEIKRSTMSFTATWSSRKTFEFLSADVHSVVQCNDVLHLLEFADSGQRTGREIIALVTHVELFDADGADETVAAIKLLARLNNGEASLVPYTQGKR